MKSYEGWLALSDIKASIFKPWATGQRKDRPMKKKGVKGIGKGIKFEYTFWVVWISGSMLMFYIFKNKIKY